MRQITSFHIAAKAALAQGSLPSTARRSKMTCGKTAVDLQSLNFNFLEFPCYMTAPVPAEREGGIQHLSCHAVKFKTSHLQQLHLSATAALAGGDTKACWILAFLLHTHICTLAVLAAKPFIPGWVAQCLRSHRSGTALGLFHLKTGVTD